MPALVADGHEVIVDERYRGRFSERPDISHLEQRATWVAGEAAQLDNAEAIVIARRPFDQVDLVRRVLRHGKIRRLFLEKPLAPTPQMALGLLDTMVESGCTVRTGHNFHMTAWGERLGEVVKSADAVSAGIRWDFRAHHFATQVQTWKRYHDLGGGALRFYGIHLIHQAAMLGFKTVLRSEIRKSELGELECWTATLAGPAGDLELLVDSNSSGHQFVVWKGANKHQIAHLSDPYEDAPALQGYDRRAGILQSMMREFLTTDRSFLEFDRLCLALWQKIEAATPGLSNGAYPK